jgi:GR25 family glycosyltransferase involved in LPS biosynthesis
MKLTAYIINLKHRTDRYNHIITELSKLDISNFNIIDAIKHDVPWKGCFFSHIKCIQHAKNNNLPYVLILEDDCIFTDDAQTHLINALTELQNLDWDMFFLGANLQKPTSRVTDSLLKLSGAWAAHAYIVHSRLYDMILNFTAEKEIDVYYNDLMVNYNVYMCDPMIAYQLPSHSDLQDGFRDYNQAMFNNYLRFKS